LKTLKRLNGNLGGKPLKPGTVVYLADQPGKSNSIQDQMIELDHASPFEWGISGKSESDYVIKVPQTIPVKDNREEEKIPSAIKIELTAGEHTVARGETLYGIATLYGVKVADLQRMNKLVVDEPLKPGMILTLKENKIEETGSLHEVKPTDTLYSIARQYGLSVKELMSLNNKTDFDLKPGQKLIVR
jgi:membrane-bound lytic murein transglycosylase D